MTTHLTPRTDVCAGESGVAERELVAAARMMLARMGVAPADLTGDSAERPPVPTFEEYLPVVEAAVSPGTAKTYGSYWNRIRAKWGSRSLLEPTPTEIKQFAEEVKAGAVQRRNSRGGRGTAENFIAALRCLYRHAENDQLITEAENPARRTAKPRRRGSNRHARSAHQMSEINHYAAITGDDPDLDTLILRLHTETACRRGGALALRYRDLDPDQLLIHLREKDGADRWQPVSCSLMNALFEHAHTGVLLMLCPNRNYRPAHHPRDARPHLPGRHRDDRPKSPGSGLIPVTLGEVKRLLAHLITTIPHRTVTWTWSHWRRRHQHRARQAHYQRRQTTNHEVLLEY